MFFIVYATYLYTRLNNVIYSWSILRDEKQSDDPISNDVALPKWYPSLDLLPQ